MDSVSARRVKKFQPTRSEKRRTGSDRGREHGLSIDALGCAKGFAVERLAGLEMKGCGSIEGTAGMRSKAPEETRASNNVANEHGASLEVEERKHEVTEIAVGGQSRFSEHSKYTLVSCTLSKWHEQGAKLRVVGGKNTR